MQISSRRRTGECTLVLWFTVFLFWSDTDMCHAIEWSLFLFYFVIFYIMGYLIYVYIDFFMSVSFMTTLGFISIFSNVVHLGHTEHLIL